MMFHHGMHLLLLHAASVIPLLAALLLAALIATGLHLARR